jgi:hypothetical protein
MVGAETLIFPEHKSSPLRGLPAFSMRSRFGFYPELIEPKLYRMYANIYAIDMHMFLMLGGLYLLKNRLFHTLVE